MTVSPFENLYWSNKYSTDLFIQTKPYRGVYVPRTESHTKIVQAAMKETSKVAGEIRGDFSSDHD
jgi:hypothetical protein